jgi:hypothetical protein
MATDEQKKDYLETWGGDFYRDPDYVEGSHPMDTDNVTWHHNWQRRPVERKDSTPHAE